MKKLILSITLNLVLCGLAFAQSSFPELEKAKEIRLLLSNRKDVKRILKDFEHDKDEDDDHTQTFSTQNADIEITFSSAETCGEEDSEKIWNVSEWKVVGVEITPKIPLRFEDLGIDVSSFRKERKYSDIKDIFVYHNKDVGIAFEIDEKDVVEDDDENSSENGEESVAEDEIDEDKIETIIIFPPNGNQFLLCDNEEGETTKKLYSQESFFSEPLEDRTGVITEYAPSVTSLTLSTNEIIIGCNNSEEGETCSESSREISVKTVGYDAENDPLTYTYKVSSGKVIGNGTDVIWDLTGVEPGTYTITVGANDGCGICGNTKTETVVVKECDNCLPKQM